MMYLRILLGVIVWLLYIVCFVPLLIIGWILIPIAAAFGAYKGSPPGIYHFTWPFMYIWDNEEDGVANNSYSGYVDMFMRIVSWSCVRNPVNNLRTLTGSPFSCKIAPERVDFIGSFGNNEDAIMPARIANIWLYDNPARIMPQWFLAWQGLYLCWYWVFKIRGKLYRVIIGYNIYPTFIFGVTPAYSNGSGFSITAKAIS